MKKIDVMCRYESSKFIGLVQRKSFISKIATHILSLKLMCKLMFNQFKYQNMIIIPWSGWFDVYYSQYICFVGSWVAGFCQASHLQISVQEGLDFQTICTLSIILDTSISCLNMLLRTYLKISTLLVTFTYILEPHI